MAKLTLTDIAGSYASTTQLNANWALIETAIENTLSRDGTSPNAMAADLDMNSYDINNVNELAADVIRIGGVSIVPTGTLSVSAATVSFTPAGTLIANDVQEALEELDSDINAHLADTVDAHDASAISFVATGGISATDVQAAIAEVDSEKATSSVLASTSNGDGASLIGIEDAGTYFTATTVEGALQELGPLGQSATTTSEGIIELATQTEVNTGTDTSRAVVPSTLKGSDFVAKAWVNFNGTGTVAIRDSFNVSSITDNGTADYTLNFTNSLGSADYSWAGSSQRSAAANGGMMVSLKPNPTSYATAQTTSSLRVLVTVSNNTNEDSDFISVIIFG